MRFIYRVLAAKLLVSIGLSACTLASDSRSISKPPASTDDVAVITTGKQISSEPVVRSPPVRVQFRDLFTGHDPSDQAIELSGAEIEIVGYLTPSQRLPFRVLVGQPTETCPLCEPPDESTDDIIPFLLVFSYFGEQKFGFRTRLRVTGELWARRNAIGPDGRIMDMRIINALVEPDARYVDPRRKPGNTIEMSASPLAHKVVGPEK